MSTFDGVQCMVKSKQHFGGLETYFRGIFLTLNETRAKTKAKRKDKNIKCRSTQF